MLQTRISYTAVLNMIRSPDRDSIGFCTSEPDPDWTGFWNKLNRIRYRYPNCIDHYSKLLNQSCFGYNWIKYFDRSTGLGSDRITERQFWTGFGFQKSPICSTLLCSTCSMPELLELNFCDGPEMNFTSPLGKIQQWCARNTCEKCYSFVLLSISDYKRLHTSSSFIAINFHTEPWHEFSTITILYTQPWGSKREGWKGALAPSWIWNLTFSYQIFGKKTVVFLVSSRTNKNVTIFAPPTKILRFTWKQYNCIPSG